MQLQLTRRELIVGLALAGTTMPKRVRAQDSKRFPSLPIGWPDEPAGRGFRIGHGFQTENTWYLPGYWHCGEDWYSVDQDTAGEISTH